MIVVLGSVTVQAGKMAEALAISQDHVNRSRLEPGCVEHGVHRDAGDANRLVFVERWDSVEALKAHFAVPESGKAVRALAAISTAPPSIAIYDATALPFPLP